MLMICSSLNLLLFIRSALYSEAELQFTHVSLFGSRSGATGGPLIGELIKRNRQVKALVRTPENIPVEFQTHPDLEVVPGSISDLSVDEFAQHLEDCDSAVSCLGHNLSFKGMFGPPYRLVTDAVRKLTEASLTLDRDDPLKLILMGSAGVSNRDLNEPVSAAQRCVIALLKALLAPHADNEAAADFLRTRAVNHPDQVEWAVVRPDNLINASEVTDYELHPSPIRSAIFDSGTTSRINVADFMAELIHDVKLWNEWKGKMPVIYNTST